VSTIAEKFSLASFDLESDEESYPVPLVGLRTMKEALVRHRRFWLACAALGILVGASFHLIIPAKYVAVTRLYLTEPTTGGTYTTADDASLAQTNTVTYGALALLHLPRKLSARPGTYTVVAESDVLLEIKANGPTPAKAVAWARALGDSFLSVREKALGGQEQLAISSLQAQVNYLEGALKHLSTAIGVLGSAPAGTSEATQVANLVNQRSTDQGQLTTLQGNLQQDILEQTAVEKGSYVLDPAQILPVSEKKVLAEDALSGLVAGLAIGAGGVVVASIISERPKRRDEIANLLGAPVELSLRGPKEPRLMRWSRLRRWARKPDASLRLVQHKLRDRLDQLNQPALGVVAVGRPVEDTAAAILASLALTLAGEDKRVSLVDMAAGRPLARLFGERPEGSSPRTVKFAGQELTLVVTPDDFAVLNREEATKGADCVLALATADPAIGAEHLAPWVGATVVVLRAGKASATLIGSVGEMLREAGIGPHAAVLLGTGSEDESFGALVEPSPFELPLHPSERKVAPRPQYASRAGY
jgi:capsular polysaccharide biosynthesis protein